MRREDRGLVGLLAVPHRLAGLLLPRGPVLPDAVLLPRLAFAGRAGVLVLGADVRVSLSSGHTLKVDPLVAREPAR
jgi:hypothetical protein